MYHSCRAVVTLSKHTRQPDKKCENVTRTSIPKHLFPLNFEIVAKGCYYCCINSRHNARLARKTNIYTPLGELRSWLSRQGRGGCLLCKDPGLHPVENDNSPKQPCWCQHFRDCSPVFGTAYVLGIWVVCCTWNFEWFVAKTRLPSQKG